MSFVVLWQENSRKGIGGILRKGRRKEEGGLIKGHLKDSTRLRTSKGQGSFRSNYQSIEEGRKEGREEERKAFRFTVKYTETCTWY